MSNERRFGISANRIFTADDPRPNTTTSILSFTRHITHVFVNVRITTVFLWLAKSYLTLGIVFRSDSQVNLRQDWIRGESSSSISDYFFSCFIFCQIMVCETRPCRERRITNVYACMILFVSECRLWRRRGRVTWLFTRAIIAQNAITWQSESATRGAIMSQDEWIRGTWWIHCLVWVHGEEGVVTPDGKGSPYSSASYDAFHMSAKHTDEWKR